MWEPISNFVKAHSIPRSFFLEFRGADLNSVLFAIYGQENRVRRIQAGVWDNEILCQGCEARFSDLDHYGWKILGKPDLTQPVLDQNFDLVGYKTKCDTDKLRRFILAVLWRASVSLRADFYKGFSLGNHEKEMIKRVFDNTLLSTWEYPTSVFKLERDFLGPYSKIIFPPMANQLKSGGLMCILYLPGLKISTMVGDASCLWMPPQTVINKPDELFMIFWPKALAQKEIEYIQHLQRRRMEISSRAS